MAAAASMIVILLSFLSLGFNFSASDCRSETMKHQNAAVKIVKTINGDIYDCVDIMKQPALQHPTLDNHQVKEVLQKINRRRKMKDSGSRDLLLQKIWLGEGCPIGTVPIPHNTGKHQQYYPFPTSLNHSIHDYNAGIECVGIQVVNEGQLFGARTQFSIHHPQGVQPGQYSAAKLIVENGQEFVAAGWIVHPDLYHDDKTRLFTAWKSGTSGGCYNTDCPGFVIVSDVIPLNYAFPKTSNPKTGEHHDVIIDIQRADAAGNWYLTVDDNTLGFWRGDLFENLENYAATIEFGGEVFSPPSTQDSPPMGSGYYCGNNPDKTAYFENIQVLHQSFGPPQNNYQIIETVHCYYAGSDAYSGGHLNGFHFLFGGKGGDPCRSCPDYS